MMKISAALPFTIFVMLLIMTEFSALGQDPTDIMVNLDFEAMRGRGRGRGDRGRGRGRGRGRRSIVPPGPGASPGSESTEEAASGEGEDGPIRRLDVNPGGSTAGSSSSIASPTHIVAPAPKKP